MTAHLMLLCHAPTTSMRATAFPADEPLDPRGLRGLASARRRLRHFDRCVASPAQSARQTAAGLSLEPTIDPALADCDYGRWRGQPLHCVEAADPQGLAEWLRDPGARPHGGESILALIERVRAWLSAQASSTGVTLAITHASIIRAAIVAAIEAEPRSFWRIDVAPLSLWRLSGREGRWNLASLAPSLRGASLRSQ
jgi:broad specificity phosphatase PhoE